LLPELQLKDLLAVSTLRQLDRALLLLAVRDPAPMKVADIRALGAKHGLKSAKTFNASGYLSGGGGKAVSTKNGWELTKDGRDHAAALISEHAPSTTPVVISTLRHHSGSLSDEDTRAFVHEAVVCFETRQLRAAVVLSWVGAVAVLQDHVIASHLGAFNTEAVRRDPKWKIAKNRDDLARMKEHDFLQLLEAIGVFGKNVKQELEGCLKLRNGCGHPNSMRIGEHRVAGHIETLILNVYQAY
jgi:hypothetical protein